MQKTPPKAVIKPRKINPELYNESLKAGYSDIIARIIAGRPILHALAIQDHLQPSLKFLNHPGNLQDASKAASRIVQAIKNKEQIAIETDHDCDGQTSHAVIFLALNEYFNVPKENIHSFIGHRLEEGYGLSEKLMHRILQHNPRPSLVITADNGSTDEPRIKILKEHSIDVIVTDHHGIAADGIPKSAFACINPTREDCEYPDSYIAGCMVAWLLMALTRKHLIEKKLLAQNSPSLKNLLDFVAVGTVADCVSIAKSHNNRAVINYGLKLMHMQRRPCWLAFNEFVQGEVTAEDIGFVLAPMLNSDGRLSTAMGSVSFLLTKTDLEAREWLISLKEHNTTRKAIQRTLIEKGKRIALKQYQANKKSCCIFLEDGHSGVHGIAASRIKDSFGRPCVFLAPKANDKNIITGSVRGIEGFHVREALVFINNKNPDLLLAFGGHQGAGGLSFTRKYLQEFEKLFEQAVVAQFGGTNLFPIIQTDGELPEKNLSLKFLNKLDALGPWGREFEMPIFEIQGTCTSVRLVGEHKTHAKLFIRCGEREIGAIWFNMREADDDVYPALEQKQIHAVVSLKKNSFRGNVKLEFEVLAIF